MEGPLEVLERILHDGFATGNEAIVDEVCAPDPTGAFFGPPSNAPIDISIFEVARVVDGRIVEHWGNPDRFALLAQTGALARLG